ncbi:MAG: two-component sensor histidine kinase, partial [Actinomycetales bacterium]|nr:two-component sensor histidine kinase [Actinomycetales bacterium]
MDVQGAPARHRWQEVLLLAVVTAEAIAQAVLATSSIELWRAGLVLALGAAL